MILKQLKRAFYQSQRFKVYSTSKFNGSPLRFELQRVPKKMGITKKSITGYSDLLAKQQFQLTFIPKFVLIKNYKKITGILRDYYATITKILGVE